MVMKFEETRRLALLILIPMETVFLMVMKYHLTVIPTRSDDTPLSLVLGDSSSEWSGGMQGPDNWTNGWRNVTADGAGDNYDARTDFSSLHWWFK